MRQTLAITRRELGALFGSPVAYIVLVVFTVLVSWVFMQGFFDVGQASLRSFIDTIPFIMLFVLPAVAMRSFAEERKTGTIDLLLTQPLRDWQIVVGKYLALLAFWAVAIVLLLNLPVTLVALGRPDVGQLAGAFLSVFLTGAAMLAVGMACSIVTENQVVAFLIGIALIFVLLIIGSPAVLSAVGPTVGGWMESASLLTHYSSLGRGVLDLRDLYYFASVIGLSLAFDLTVLQSRTWK